MTPQQFAARLEKVAHEAGLEPVEYIRRIAACLSSGNCPCDACIRERAAARYVLRLVAKRLAEDGASV